MQQNSQTEPFRSFKHLLVIVQCGIRFSFNFSLLCLQFLLSVSKLATHKKIKKMFHILVFPSYCLPKGIVN